MGGLREQDGRGLHCTHQRGGEYRVHLRVHKALAQLLQLCAALLAQGQVGAAADIKPLQVALGDAVADQMQLKGFHKLTPRNKIVSLYGPFWQDVHRGRYPILAQKRHHRQDF